MAASVSVSTDERQSSRSRMAGRRARRAQASTTPESTSVPGMPRAMFSRIVSLNRNVS